MLSKYKHFSVAFKQSEFDNVNRFFQKFGGFSKFVKTGMENAGYRDVSDLVEAAYKIKKSSLNEYNDMENSLSDGL